MRILSKSLKAFLQALGNKRWHPEMKRTADQTRSITAFWQIIAQTVVHKISHTLRWSCLLHIRLLPTLLLYPFLEMHHSQRILQFLFRLYNIFRMCLYHHTGITPGSTTVARTHTIHHQLLRTCSSRNHKTARAHTEAVHTPSIYLSYKTILGCRKILSSAIPVVILYLVDELGRMLQSNTYGNTLGFYFNLRRSQIAIDIPGTMTCSKNHRSTIILLCTCCQVNSFNPNHTVTFQDKPSHLGLKMHLTATIDNRIAHILYHARQLICTDMRMGICKDVRIGTMLAEDIQNLIHATTLLASGIKLTVTIRSCTTFTKTIVALTIHLLGLGDVGKVLFTLTHVLATLQDNRAISQLYQT